MTDVNANINVNIDTKAALASLKTLQAEISSFNNSVIRSNSQAVASQRGMLATLTSQIGVAGQFSTSITNVESSVSRLGTAIDKNKLSLGEYFKYGAASTKTFGRMFSKEHNDIMGLAADRVKRLQTQYIALEKTQTGATRAMALRPLSLFNADAAIAIQRQQLFNKLLHDGSTSLINFGKNTQWAGRQLMVGFSLPLAAFGVMAGKTFMDLDKQARDFKRVYGDIFTAPDEIERNLKSVQELGLEYTKYGISLKDTMAVASSAAAAGMRNEALTGNVEESLRLATIGQIDYQEALTTTITLQNAFKVSNQDLAPTVDFIGAVANQTVLTVQDLSDAIPRVAPVIQGLGGDVKDLAVMLVAMKAGGVSASQGANALKSGLASLINPTKAAVEMTDKFGININKIIKSNKGDLMGTVEAFGSALSKLDDFGRQQVLEKVFGKYQFARIGALFENINDKTGQVGQAMDLLGMSVEDLASLSDKSLNQIAESTTAKFQSAVEKLKVAIAPIGEIFLKIATPLIDMVTKVLNKFNELGPTAKKFITILVAGLGIVVPAVIMLVGLFANFAGNMIKGFSLLNGLFARIKSGGSVFKYMAGEELDAAAAAATLEGRAGRLTSALNIQREAVLNLSRAYGIYVASASAAARNLPQGFRGRAPRKMATGGVVSPAGGYPPRSMATGGFVAGTGNKDSEPALLMPGEFVVNKKAAQENGPILSAMNDGTIKGYEDGTQRTHITGARQTTASEALTGKTTQSLRNFLVIIEKVESVLGRSISAMSTVSNLIVEMPSKFNAAMKSQNKNRQGTISGGMTGAQFGKQFSSVGIEKWRITSNIAKQNFDELAPHLAILDQNILDITRDMTSVGDLNIDDVTRQAFEKLPPASRKMLSEIEELSREYNNLRVSVRQLDTITNEEKAKLKAAGITVRRGSDPNRQYIDAEGLGTASTRSRQETRSVGPSYRRARLIGIGKGEELDGGARVSIGAASPAKDGEKLVGDYVDGMSVGAAKNKGQAKSAGSLLGDTFDQGAKSSSLSEFGTRQSGALRGERYDISTRQMSMSELLPGNDGTNTPNGPRAPMGFSEEEAGNQEKRTKKIGRSFSNLSMKIGGVSMAATLAAGAFSSMEGPVGDFASKIFPLLGVLDLLTIPLMFMGSGVPAAAAPSLAAMGAAAAGATPAVAGLATAETAAAAPLLPLIAVIGLVVAAIAALAVAFKVTYDRFEPLREAVSSLIETLKVLGSEIFGELVASFKQMFGITDKAGVSFGGFGDILQKIASFLGPIFTVAIKMITTQFMYIGNAIKIVIKAFQIFFNVGKMVAGIIVGSIGWAFDWLLEKLGPLGEGVRNFAVGFANVFVQIPQIISNVFSSVTQFIEDAVNAAIDAINRLIELYAMLPEKLRPFGDVRPLDPVDLTIGAAPAISGITEPAGPGLDATNYDSTPYYAPKKEEEEEEDPPGGGKEKSFLETLIAEMSANEKLYLTAQGVSKKYILAKGNFFGVFQQLRGMGVSETIIDALGVGEEGLKAANELLSKGQKKIKEIVDRFAQTNVLGPAVEAARKKIAEASNKRKAQGIINASSMISFTDEEKNTLLGDQNVVDAINAASIKGKGALAEYLTSLKQIAIEAKTPANLFAQEIKDLTLANQLNTKSNQDQIKIYQDKIDNINKEIEAVQKLNDMDQGRIRILDRQKEMIQREIDALEKLNAADQRRISSLQRQDEIRNRNSDAISHELDVMSKTEQGISDLYNERIKALDKVEKANSRILQQQKDQLNISQALSSGDIYAATAAANEARQNQIQASQDNMKQGLQAGMENQIAGLTTSGGLTRKEAEAQIAGIKEQSYQTSLLIRDIEDTIYQRNLDMIPLKDLQLQIDIQIRDINDQIYIREDQIKLIQSQQLEPLNQSLKLEQEILKIQDDKLKQQVDQLNLQADLAGLTEDEADRVYELAKQWEGVGKIIADINRITKDRDTALRATPPERKKGETDKQFADKLAKWEQRLADIEKTRVEDIKNVKLPGMYKGGMAKYKMGGMIGYAAGGRAGVDSIPAMLTPGEFVMRKASVDKYGAPMLSSMNMGAFKMPNYKVGSDKQISVNAKTTNNNTSVNAPMYNSYSVSVNVSGTTASADDIANKTIMKIKQIQNTAIRSGRGY